MVLFRQKMSKIRMKIRFPPLPDTRGCGHQPDWTGARQQPDWTGACQQPDWTAARQQPDWTGDRHEPTGRVTRQQQQTQALGWCWLALS